MNVVFHFWHNVWIILVRYALNLGSVSKYMACTHLNGDTIVYGGATSVFGAEDA